MGKGAKGIVGREWEETVWLDGMRMSSGGYVAGHGLQEMLDNTLLQSTKQG